MQLSEQWVLVTGGARGLGQSITRALAREGAGVVINYLHSDAAAQALAKELTAAEGDQRVRELVGLAQGVLLVPGVEVGKDALACPNFCDREIHDPLSSRVCEVKNYQPDDSN